jgi:hypothetical protein
LEVVDHIKYVTIFHLFLNHVLSKVFYKGPCPHQLAVSHVRPFNNYARLQALQLQHCAVANVVLVYRFTYIHIPHHAHAHQSLVGYVVQGSVRASSKVEAEFFNVSLWGSIPELSLSEACPISSCRLVINLSKREPYVSFSLIYATV